MIVSPNPNHPNLKSLTQKDSEREDDQSDRHVQVEDEPGGVRREPVRRKQPHLQGVVRLTHLAVTKCPNCPISGISEIVQGSYFNIHVQLSLNSQHTQHLCWEGTMSS